MKHPFLESDLYYNFKRTPIAVLSFFVFLIIVIMAIFADIIAPHTPFEPLTLNLLNGFTPPMQANEFTGTIFLMGTDDQGRDLFSSIDGNENTIMGLPIEKIKEYLDNYK